MMRKSVCFLGQLKIFLFDEASIQRLFENDGLIQVDIIRKWVNGDLLKLFTNDYAIMIWIN